MMSGSHSKPGSKGDKKDAEKDKEKDKEKAQEPSDVGGKPKGKRDREDTEACCPCGNKSTCANKHWCQCVMEKRQCTNCAVWGRCKNKGKRGREEEVVEQGDQRKRRRKRKKRKKK